MGILDKYFWGRVNGKQRWLMYGMIGMFILSYGCFRYINWSNRVGDTILAIICLIMFFAVVSMRKKIKHAFFSNIVLLLMFIPFLSSINTSFVYNESVVLSIRMSFNSIFIWSLYFLLHLLMVKENTILKFLFVVAMIIFFLQVVQQFTYPNVYFGLHSAEQILENKGQILAEERNGLWRFKVNHNLYYTAPVLFFLIGLIFKKANFVCVLILVLLVVSVYLTLTRQVIFSFLLSVCCSIVLYRTKSFSLKKVMFFMSLLGIILYNFENLFEDLQERTIEETNDDNIRIYAASFFLNDSLRNPLTFLFGYGSPCNLVEYLHDRYRFFVSDVGFIGIGWTYGYIYVSICYYLLYNLLWTKRSVIPIYIRLFVIFTGIMSIMIFPLGVNASTNLIWTFLLYICDLHIKKSPLAVQSTILS